MIILAIDPGSYQSGCCLYCPELNEFYDFGKISNEELLQKVGQEAYNKLVIEDITSQGTVGKTTFDTCKWIGRFSERANTRNIPFEYITRGAVKKTLTGKINKIKDGDIRKAVIAEVYPKYSRKDPGPLKGVKADIWQACGLALAWKKIHDKQ